MALCHWGWPGIGSTASSSGNTVYTQSITELRRSAIQPASAGCKHTSLINGVAGCLIKVFMYLTFQNKLHHIRVFRNVLLFFLLLLLLALSHGTVLTQSAFILSYAFIKPTNLLLLFLLQMCLNCKHSCTVTEINIQLNPLRPKPVSLSEIKDQPESIVPYESETPGEAHCICYRHCPRTLSDRKQHE